MHGVFARGVEMELLQGPGLLIESKGIAGFRLFTCLNGVAVVRQRHRAINVMCLQRGEVRVRGGFNVDGGLVHPALTGFVGLVQFAPVFRCAFAFVAPV